MSFSTELWEIFVWNFCLSETHFFSLRYFRCVTVRWNNGVLEQARTETWDRNEGNENFEQVVVFQR